MAIVFIVIYEKTTADGILHLNKNFGLNGESNYE